MIEATYLVIRLILLIHYVILYYPVHRNDDDRKLIAYLFSFVVAQMLLLNSFYETSMQIKNFTFCYSFFLLST